MDLYAGGPRTEELRSKESSFDVLPFWVHKANTTGNQEFAVCQKFRHVQFLGHTVKIIFAVRSTKTTRRNRNTRRNTTSPCAAYKTHGDPRLRRVPTLRHTAKLVPRGPPLMVVGCRTTPSRFAVCQGTAHGEHLFFPCASGQHTAKVQPRVPDPNRC